MGTYVLPSPPVGAVRCRPATSSVRVSGTSLSRTVVPNHPRPPVEQVCLVTPSPRRIRTGSSVPTLVGGERETKGLRDEERTDLSPRELAVDPPWSCTTGETTSTLTPESPGWV